MDDRNMPVRSLSFNEYCLKQNKITLDGYINYNARLSHDDIHMNFPNIYLPKMPMEIFMHPLLTLNLEHAKFSDTISFIGAIEILMRATPFASGISGPGRNLIFGLPIKIDVLHKKTYTAEEALVKLQSY